MADRFFVGGGSLRGQEIILQGQQVHQIRNVLRKKSGDHIIVLDNSGFEYEVELKSIEKEEIGGQVTEKRRALGEPVVGITLYQSLLGREKFEGVLQNCTEVGVRRFVPVLTEHSIVRDKLIKANKMGRWRRIIQEAAEQSGRGRIPELEQARKFEEAIAELAGFDCKLMACPRGEGVSLRTYLRGGDREAVKTVALFIGPEGGFSEKEMRSAGDNAVKLVSLGRRILRTETAAVVASSIILYELGEMEG